MLPAHAWTSSSSSPLSKWSSMLLFMCFKDEEDLPNMQVLQHKVDQVPVPREDGVLHGGEGDDDHSTRAGCLASGGDQRETGNEEEEISQVGEGQGAHGHVGEGSSQGGGGGS